MGYTLGEAAKATGKHKATISKAIKKGRISAPKNDLGAFDIDPSELHRVYPLVEQGNQPSVNGQQDATPENTSSIRVLEVQLKAIEEQRDILKAERDRLIEQLSASELERIEMRKQVTGLLGHDGSGAGRVSKPGVFVRGWHYLFGRMA